MPKDYSGQEPVGWFTVKGVHIPLFEGETTDDAIKRLRRDMIMDTFMSDTNYQSFNGYTQAKKFMEDARNSNCTEWQKEVIDSDAVWAISYYTDAGYKNINGLLHKKGYNNLDKYEREEIDKIDKAIDNFELYEPIKVTRQADIRMLGFEDKFDKPSKSEITKRLFETHGHLEYPCYLSSSVDNEGVDVNGLGVVVHIGVPAGKGIGAYIAHPRLAIVPDENEFMFARNTVLKYDIASLKKNRMGYWEINAEWVMTAQDE